MRGFCLLLAVFATLYQLASAQSSAIQRRQLIAEQEDIACALKEDDSLRTQFEYIVRALHGVHPNYSELNTLAWICAMINNIIMFKLMISIFLTDSSLYIRYIWACKLQHGD